MQELQIVSLENTDIVGWDFEQISGLPAHSEGEFIW